MFLCRINKTKGQPEVHSDSHATCSFTRAHVNVHSRLSGPAVFTPGLFILHAHPVTQPESWNHPSQLLLQQSPQFHVHLEAQKETSCSASHRPVHTQFSRLNTVLILLSSPTCHSSSGERCFSWGVSGERLLPGETTAVPIPTPDWVKSPC